jgi:hypothetical protein
MGISSHQEKSGTGGFAQVSNGRGLGQFIDNFMGIYSIVPQTTMPPWNRTDVARHMVRFNAWPQLRSGMTRHSLLV